MRVTVKQRPDTGKWQARWRENGRQRAKDFARKGDATRFASAQESRLQLGIDYDAGRETLTDFVQEYWRSYAIPNLADATRATYLQTWAKHIDPRLGHLELREITPAVVEDFRAQMQAAGAGDPTVIKAMALLQGILARAVIRGRITHNTVRDVRKPRQATTREIRPLPPQIVEQIRGHLSHRDATLVSLLAYQGLRPHEAFTLDVEDLRPKIRIDERKTGRQGRTRRVAWLAPAKQDVLQWLLARGTAQTGLVFPARDGGPWNEGEWRYWRRYVYQPAAQAAGVTGDMRPYRLRGSFVSLLLWEGKNVAFVAREAGHSVATLARHYAGVIDELEDLDPDQRITAEDAIRRARGTTSTERTG